MNLAPNSNARALRSIVAIAILSTAATACTRPQTTVEVPQRVGQQGNDGNADGRTVDVSMPLPASSLEKYRIDLNNARYKFTYLEVAKEDALTFTNGTATITIPGLPPNREGTVSLEVLEGGTLKLRGSQPNVKLSATTANNLSITLQPVDGSNPNPIVVPMTTSVTILVRVEGDQGLDPIATPIPSPGPQPIVTPIPTPVPIDPQLGSWDGRTDRGNDRWTIVPVN